MGLGVPNIAASLNTSHTQDTSVQQQGAVINSGISFAPLPTPQIPPIMNPGAYVGSGGLPGASWEVIGVVIVAGLGLLLILKKVFSK